jgi:hypothetical protein
MLRAEGLPRQTAVFKLQYQPIGLNTAPATTNRYPNRFAHSTSPSQSNAHEQMQLL